MTDERDDRTRSDDPNLDPVDPMDPKDPDATIPATPGDEDATLVSGGEPSLPGHEEPGTMIGNYKLVRPLGEGGFGTVFLAEQLKPVKRNVALKIIKLGMDTRQVIQRFEAEKQALALMDHPGIAKVFDAGSTESGRPYFVMELVEGVPVTEYCDRHRLRTRQRLALFREICAAVQHAHQKGVIHRDIKPSNVLVAEVEGRPVPKVIDFGIAKATDARLTEQTIFTQEAQFIGTPAYMSPEQTGQAGLDVDTRSDIYSLGVLLYEMLAGVTPFSNEELRSAGFAEIQRIIREDDPPRPSTRASRLGERLSETAQYRQLRAAQLVKRLRGELDWIVMKCLEKDRTRRYETANGLARDVARFLADEPVTASPPSRSYRLKKLIVRNRAVFATGAVMAVLLAAGILGTSIGMVRAREAEQVAVAEAEKATQVAAFLTDMLAGVGPSAARGRDTEMLEEILQETDNRIGEELGDQPEVEGEIRSHLGMTYYDLGRLEEAREQYTKARDLLSAVHGEENGDVARQYSNLGLVNESLEAFDEAETNHLRALELRRQLVARDEFADQEVRESVQQDLAMNLVNLANLYVNISRYQEAEPLLLEGLEQLRALKGNENEEVAICLNSLGNLMQHLRRYDEAGPYYEEALRVHTEQLGEDHPYVITDMFNLGWLAMNTGEMEDAARRFAEIVTLSRRVYQEAHPNLVLAINAQATAEQRSSRPAAAEPLFRESVAMAEEVYGPEHTSTADQILDLGECLSDLGRFEEADELSRQAIAIHEKNFGADHSITLRSRYNYAYSIYNRGEHERAIPLLESSVAAYAAALGREHPNTALALSNLGRALRDAGQADDAIAPLTESRDVRRQVLGPDDLMVGVSNHDLGKARYLQGRLAAAETLYNRAMEIYAVKLAPDHRGIANLRLLQARVALGQGQDAEALELLSLGLPITVAARGEDHWHVRAYQAAEGRARAELGELAAALDLVEKVEPGLADLEALDRAKIQLDLGWARTRMGDFEEAENHLLAAHRVLAEKLGDDVYPARQAVDGLIAMYEAWAEAGSAEAAAAARQWRARRS
jgi:serine/threonine protein kinase/tetratricopeptide (TPR) repeat protein